MNVPVIDLSPLLTPNTAAYTKLIQDIEHACKEWGFFYIENHGISLSLIEQFQQEAVQFFTQTPPTILTSIRRTKENSRGYYDDELTKNKVDWKQGYDFGAQDGDLNKTGLDGYNQWPPAQDSTMKFETTMRAYFEQLTSLGKVLMELIAQSLQLDKEYFATYFDQVHSSFVRLNYYPVCPSPEDHMAVHHHTDAGAVTILLQDNDVQSLQVLRDGVWYDVKPIPNTFVINIGDMIQVWSNNKYKAPVHQVKANASKARFSAPFFYNPAYATNVQPIAPINATNFSPYYRTVNWGHFRSQRFAGDYADQGEEIQISHFVIAE